MEATLSYALPTSRLCRAARNSHRSVNLPAPNLLPNSRTVLKPLTLSNSLKTSSNCDHDFHEQEKIGSCNPFDSGTESFGFPIVVCQSGTVSRYFWDGGGLKLVAVDGINESLRSDKDSFLNYEDGVRKLVNSCGSALRNFFLPRQVSENYLKYVKWKFLHRVFSSALQVLATQAMFRAIGIGFSRSLPSAAALNWVLKDGLGRLSRCIYTATLASAFDTNLKRVRFSTSILFSLSIGVELLTPFFPNYFLLLATIANTAKQISLACHLATGPAVHRSFAIADNLGEVSAKSQTLTKNRLELVINTWNQLGYVPSPAQVSEMEGLDFFWKQGMELLPIRIGCLNPKRSILELSAMTMRSLSDEDFYFTCMESSNTRCRLMDLGIVVCIREGAGAPDIIMGLLQACNIRKAIQHDMIRWERWLEAREYSDPVVCEWWALMEESRRFAQTNRDMLIESMSRMGWACRNVLLSAQEQSRYSFVVE